jgi:hypothetical protein
MEINILEVGKKTRGKGLALSCGEMGTSTKETGSTIKKRETASISGRTEISMSADGKTTK